MPPNTSLNSPLKIALQVLAAAAGLGTVITFVGGSMLWVRFDKLDLAADQAVALLPKQLLVVVGAHALALPVLLGALAALVLALIEPTPDRRVRRSFNVALAAIVALALTSAIVAAHEFDLPEQFLVYATVLAGAAAIWKTARQSTLRRHVVQVVLIAFVACGAVLAVVTTWSQPELEPVAVLLNGDKAVAGFYVGQTADRVYVAPLPGLGDPNDPFADDRIDRLVELPRADVRRMALRDPAGIGTDGAGRHEAQTLLGDLRMQHAGARAAAAEQVVTTATPELTFAPLVHLDAREPAFPMSAETFLDNSWLVWGHDGCADYAIALKSHLERPESKRAQIMGSFDRTRLAGAAAYAHAAGCKDRGATFTAADHTRAFDAKARRAGLPAKDGFHLDLWDERRAGERRVRKEGAQQYLQKTPVYTERSIERDAGQPALRITYWLFYGLSIPPGPKSVTRLIAHEGDWERVSVLLRDGPVAGQYMPLSARYHYHDESRDVPWAAVDRVGVGSDAPTHPVAFSARGSHATYPRANRYENVFKIKGQRRFAVWDLARACAECPQWRTWEMLLDAKAQLWYGFGGAWGRAGSIGGTTGPLGPSRYKIRGLGAAPENALAREARVAGTRSGQ